MGAAEDIIAGVITSQARWSDRAHALASRALFDTIAVGIAGSRSLQAGLAQATINPSLPGPAPLTPLWSDHRSYHVADAAYVTGTATHGMDWDDYMHPMHGHCSAVLVATVFPLAEALDVDGATLRDAFLTGYQVDWLASLALSHDHYRRGWHATSTVGVLGAAAAAAHLLELSSTQVRSALGAAASLASGVRVNFGTTTKASHGGQAARAGIQAALLARAGATSSPHWLTGAAGMIESFGAEFTPAEAVHQVEQGSRRGVHGIEEPWGLVQKPYACCGSIHGAVDALLLALRENDIRTEDITSVVAHVDPHVTAIMRHERPTDENQARYSPTWVLAAAAVDRRAGPAQFNTAAVRRADIHEFRARVTVLSDLEVGDDDRFAGRVEVHARYRIYTREVREAKGHPRRPFTEADLKDKAEVALLSVGDARGAARLLAQVADLERSRVRTVGEAIRDFLVDPAPRAEAPVSVVSGA